MEGRRIEEMADKSLARILKYLGLGFKIF